MNLFVVTSGEYDGQDIIGIFDSEEKAKEYIADYKKKHGNRYGGINDYIEEFILNKRMVQL